MCDHLDLLVNVFRSDTLLSECVVREDTNRGEALFAINRCLPINQQAIEPPQINRNVALAHSMKIKRYRL